MKPDVKTWFPLPEEWKTVTPQTEDSARLFRISAPLLELTDKFENLIVKTEGIVHVKSGNKLIGSMVSVDLEGKWLVGVLSIDYASPERLEVESDQKVFAKGTFDITSILVSNEGTETITSATLREIELTKETLNVPPVSRAP